MEMTGEQRIPASQAKTWAALNDAEFLKGCVPGCEAIEPAGENAFSVQMTARVGPVTAKFKGRMQISDVKAPHSYAIAFDGQGGVAGFARGSATVRLTPQGDAETLLQYQAKANVGGKLAQIGSRLVDAAAQKVANEFFNAFNEKMTSLHATAVHAEEEHHLPEPVPRDADLPDMDPASLGFFAAGALIVVFVALVTLL